MVKHFNECHYCRVVDNSGLFSPIDASASALCRDCYDLLPEHIDHSQWDKFLKAKMKKVKHGI